MSSQMAITVPKIIQIHKKNALNLPKLIYNKWNLHIDVEFIPNLQQTPKYIDTILALKIWSTWLKKIITEILSYFDDIRFFPVINKQVGCKNVMGLISAFYLQN